MIRLFLKPFSNLTTCWRFSLLSLFYVAPFLLTGCLPTGSSLTTATPESTITLTPSPTFVIPTAAPTSTWTPGPTLTPTADIFTSVGTLLFQDDFEGSTGWSLSQDQLGAASISDDKLTLVASRPKVFRIAASPAAAPENFFIQISAYAELCRPGDVYGIVFRYSSDQEHLRFLMNCSGAASVTSVQQGRSFTLVPETDTYAALSGQRIPNTMGIIARGSIYTFYINQIEVFQVKETQLLGTGFGVIVRTDENDLATVSFDNIRLYTLNEEAGAAETPLDAAAAAEASRTPQSP
ncbi:MAG: hypothetical protein JXA25_07980 [Anaerolineales bacterium]|nr:hypothetical protein [Anaerolineales bacterium]